MSPNPCVGCGACCTCYRVSFYWREASDQTPGGVPVELTEDVHAQLRAMRGTNRPDPYCIALEGEVGVAARCAIHPSRPNPCREFEASWSEGRHNARCDAARAKYGLAPLRPEDWAEGEDDDRRPPRPLRPAA